MTTTVAEKLVAAYGRLLPPDRAWLEAQGVPPLAIHMYPGPIGITPEPSPMFIRPVYAEAAYSDIVGAVAIRDGCRRGNRARPAFPDRRRRPARIAGRGLVAS